ncbi:MAG: Transcription antitermination factor NusB [uncultured bacterium]|nr:MAG: Transcription antitermination factor NusB [uncultured bacterium]OFW69285.1 MAG: transcription antitermination factor NusB [Alphaproteobacteria bacterium GWC2_42_16]OFW73683.1 MAG: transcription antitermination factor NusB [Alphaproteobacteria bacterium GWA2_41_27]OFW81988.1 MAG: transcription antitermination factor NusB [Alphaproteobacteria bacterium RIFCSPHIGHO2_12_FULL_42_100]OFW86034.1 MAG: transcription antitermination factor NusB [Alphaproteobacteria bacterium RBG_16_42_14]OFW9115
MSKRLSSKHSFKGRSLSRFASVQALFQIEKTEEPASTVVLQFLEHRFKDKESGLLKADRSFFVKLTEGAWELHLKTDEIVKSHLKPDWTLERIEPVTRAIFRASLYELLETKTPPPVIIDEYLNITHAFFNASEVSFVNGILNKVAGKVHSED